MAAADWARGVRGSTAATFGDRAPAGVEGQQQASNAAARGKPHPDLPRRLAFDLLRAVDERDAYANLALPALLRERGLDLRGTRRSPPS